MKQTLLYMFRRTQLNLQNLVDNDTVVSVNKIVNTDKDDEDTTPSGGCTIEDMSAGEQTSIIGTEE